LVKTFQEDFEQVGLAARFLTIDFDHLVLVSATVDEQFGEARLDRVVGLPAQIRLRAHRCKLRDSTRKSLALKVTDRRIVLRKELLPFRFELVPRRIPHHRVKPRALPPADTLSLWFRLEEQFRERQFPTEGANLVPLRGRIRRDSPRLFADDVPVLNLLHPTVGEQRVGRRVGVIEKRAADAQPVGVEEVGQFLAHGKPG
jgi:hypothetical protein